MKIQTEIDDDQSSETGEEQPRSNEKNDCQRHLRHDECRSKRLRTRTGCSRTLALIERTRNGRTRELHHGARPKAMPVRIAHEPRRDEHPQVDGDRGRARDLRGDGGPQGLDSPPGHDAPSAAPARTI